MKSLQSTCYIVFKCWMFLLLLVLVILLLLLLLLLDWEVADLGFSSSVATYNILKETCWISKLTFVKYCNVIRYSLEFHLILHH